MRPLIIVERDELQLYIYLYEDYGAQGVEIVFDRRHAANRRRTDVRPEDDRRRGERRSYDVSQTLATYGWVFVHRHPPAGNDLN